jgi:hypothetical protein
MRKLCSGPREPLGGTPPEAVHRSGGPVALSPQPTGRESRYTGLPACRHGQLVLAPCLSRRNLAGSSRANWGRTMPPTR